MLSVALSETLKSEKSQEKGAKKVRGGRLRENEPPSGAGSPRLGSCATQGGDHARQRVGGAFADLQLSDRTPRGVVRRRHWRHARNSLKNYLPRTNPFFQYAVQIEVAPEEEIGVRLADMGIDPAREVRQLVMTHLHHDHTGGGSGCRQDPKARTRGRLMIRDARAAQTDQQSPHPTGGQLCPAATAGVSRRRPRSKIF